MTVIGYSKITSKGQITLPRNIRWLLKVDKGQSVAFGLSRNGVIVSRCKMDIEKSPFSKKEWQKVEKLASAKGKVYHNPDEAKRHIASL